ncbi:hypothetical protein GZH47_33490 (plasmid) [Paenibacillus rhizovicinus]|uniref:Uncharacterized protein n=1 Tax=Paenibacillus rhizovicinus TaxID=2704463 RepID=A0A6C0PBB3_9BACL|nr:hypothetical protein [Paenibacillus rhizovicinus]QHW35808.1 hypothetical protein GZH47_33490 [Paenibacillus rhizovicinus]
MGFTITKDNIHTEPDEKQWDKTGKRFKCICVDEAKSYAEGQHKFRLLDDDRNVYLYGKSDDDNCFCPLDWSQPLWGTTEIQYYDEQTREYKTL